MKRELIITMLCVFATLAVAETNEPALPFRVMLPPRVPSISDIVGSPTNQWLYVWPHDLLPDNFDGFGVKSTPVDPTKKNRGCTMQNWGKAVSVTNSNVSVAIICRRDYPMSTSQPWMERSKPAGSYRPIKFHYLPSGLATPPSGAATTKYFVFRMKDIVFDLTAEGESEDLCKSALLQLGEQILKFNTKESPTTQSTLPSEGAPSDER